MGSATLTRKEKVPCGEGYCGKKEVTYQKDPDTEIWSVTGEDTTNCISVGTQTKVEWGPCWTWQASAVSWQEVHKKVHRFETGTACAADGETITMVYNDLGWDTSKCERKFEWVNKNGVQYIQDWQVLPSHRKPAGHFTQWTQLHSPALPTCTLSIVGYYAYVWDIFAPDQGHFGQVQCLETTDWTGGYIPIDANPPQP